MTEIMKAIYFLYKRVTSVIGLARRVLLVASLSILFAFPLGGIANYLPVMPQLWAAEWSEVLKQARKEGKVTVLGPRTEDVRPFIIQGFKRAFRDISLEYQPGNLGALISRLRAELRIEKTGLDIAITGASSILRNKDLFESLPPRLILPNVIDPDKWRSSKGKGFKWADREQRYALI